MDELTKIVQAQLGGLDTPISESDLISLGLSLGAPLLLDALDLVDRRQVTLLSLPSPRTLLLVSSSSTTAKYSVHLTPFSSHLPLGYCPCPTFALKVYSTNSDHPRPPTGVPICKHLLAARIATHLGNTEDKEGTLNWLASWAQGFRESQGS